MLEDFLISLRVVVPMALLLGVGVFARRAHMIDQGAARQLDKLNFEIFCPATLFNNIYSADLSSTFNPRVLLFVFCALALVFLLAMTVPRRLVRDRRQCASIAQAIVRSNYLIFGVATAEALYGKGNAGFVALMGTFVIPAINILAVIALELNCSGTTDPLKIIRSVLKNPMIVAAIAAITVSLLHIRFPEFAYAVVEDLGSVTTTVSFLSLGVSLDLKAVRANRRPLAIGILLRMAVVPLLMMPAAVLCGFRGQELCCLMVLFSAPTGVATYPLATAMGADGQLAGQLVYTTTLISVFTMFCYTFLFRSLGYL